jgi:drug/metabolite transporter (DMT)-like permease
MHSEKQSFLSVRPSSVWHVHALMVIASFLVSTSFTVGKAITHGLDPATLTLFRFLLASLFFTPIVARRYGLRFPRFKALTGYAAISLAITGFFWCMFASLRLTSALNTSALFTLVPGIAGIYARLLLKEKLGQYRLAALLIGMIGATWVVFRGDLRRFLMLDANEGDFLFLFGCFLMAFYTPLVKKFHQRESMAEMTLWILITGSVWLLLFSARNFIGSGVTLIAPSVWFGIVYLAIFTTIITFFLTQYATLRIGPTRVMAYSYLYPAFVLLINWGWGLETPTTKTLPGIITVLLAMLVVQQGASKDTSRSPAIG